MLFVTWNDGHPPAQLSLPEGTTLELITNGPVALDDEAHTEFMLDAARVRCAYLVDVPANTMIANIEPLDIVYDHEIGQVVEDDSLVDVALTRSYAEPYEDEQTQVDWPTLGDSAA